MSRETGSYISTSYKRTIKSSDADGAAMRLPSCDQVKRVVASVWPRSVARCLSSPTT